MGIESVRTDRQTQARESAESECTVQTDTRLFYTEEKQKTRRTHPPNYSDTKQKECIHQKKKGGPGHICHLKWSQVNALMQC
jgi:hypothetical protein